jgi:hypothetical protein
MRCECLKRHGVGEWEGKLGRILPLLCGQDLTCKSTAIFESLATIHVRYRRYWHHCERLSEFYTQTLTALVLLCAHRVMMAAVDGMALPHSEFQHHIEEMLNEGLNNPSKSCCAYKTRL